MNRYKKIGIIVMLAVSGVLGFLASWWQQPHIVTPIKDAATFHYPTVFVKQLQGDKQAGEKIYKEYCAACHNPAPLIDVRAPLLNDYPNWRARNARGIQALVKTTLQGKAAMPARGGCFECSDAQLRQAILYMLHNSLNQPYQKP